MDAIKLASAILRKVAVDLAVDKSFYAIDGRGYGSAEIVELADRLAALQAEPDALRYRWLRAAGHAEYSDGLPFICINTDGRFSLWNGEPADAAIDAARGEA